MTQYQFQCPGASLKSDTAPSFIEIEQMPGPDSKGLTKILCPRLNQWNCSSEKRCYEGEIRDYDSARKD